MYRDGLKSAQDRHRATLQRVDKLRVRLAARRHGTKLPADLQQQLDALEPLLRPEEDTAEGFVAAEEALEEYERLLEQTHVTWKLRRKVERRRRRDEALASFKNRKWPRWQKLTLLLIVVVGSLAVVRHVQVSVACLGWVGCARHGACSPELLGDQCIAASDEECLRSTDCQERGRCTARDGTCIAAANSDCERSDECAYYDYCVAEDGHCVKEEP